MRLGALFVTFVAAITVGSLWAPRELSAQEAAKIVVNKNNSSTGISKADLKKIFLGQKRFWSPGKGAVPVIQTGAAKAAFYGLIGLSETAFKKEWIKVSLSGRCDPPSTVKSDEQVIAFVKGNEGAIGFVSGKADLKDVKALTVR